jgi:hypothetical protein
MRTHRATMLGNNDDRLGNELPVEPAHAGKTARASKYGRTAGEIKIRKIEGNERRNGRSNDVGRDKDRVRGRCSDRRRRTDRKRQTEATCRRRRIGRQVIGIAVNVRCNSDHPYAQREREHDDVRAAQRSQSAQVVACWTEHGRESVAAHWGAFKHPAVDAAARRSVWRGESYGIPCKDVGQERRAKFGVGLKSDLRAAPQVRRFSGGL